MNRSAALGAGLAAAGTEEILVTYHTRDDRRCLPPVTEALPLGTEVEEGRPDG